jgi:predicted acyltransferase
MSTVTTSGRLVSLDTFRGITIAGMILVNNPGTWSSIYGPLKHAPWHGWTPTDLVFPFFLFIVGVAIVYAYSGAIERGSSSKELVQKAAIRSAKLFGLGLIMAAYPFFQFEPTFGIRESIYSLRIMGVLQRIAVCYLIVSIFFVYMKPKTMVWVFWSLLIGYWAAMAWIPVPGYGAGQIDSATGNLAAYIDRLIFGKHLWVGAQRQWDPEGLISSLPAIATTMLGVWTGLLLRNKDLTPVDKTAQLMVRGSVLLIIGYIWDLYFPINKNIWTSSYTIFTGGQAMLGLALCYWIADVKGKKTWTQPFVVYGVNAITVFFFSGILAKTLGLIRVGPEGASMTLQSWIFQNLFNSWLPTIDASLAYAVTWIVMWYFILLWMYKKNIIWKI